jgi:hypothetical protein
MEISSGFMSVDRRPCDILEMGNSIAFIMLFMTQTRKTYLTQTRKTHLNPRVFSIFPHCRGLKVGNTTSAALRINALEQNICIVFFRLIATLCYANVLLLLIHNINWLKNVNFDLFHLVRAVREINFICIFSLSLTLQLCMYAFWMKSCY